MKKIPMFLMIISAYLFLYSLLNSLTWGYFIVGAVFILNIIYPFFLAKKTKNPKELLLHDMLIKILLIPFYCLVFLGGLGLSIHGLIIIIPILALIDYFMLIPSTIYGTIGILLARKDRLISTKAMVINLILHYMFCLDIISAIYMFFKVRKSLKSSQTETAETTT